jgi:hypothetical protein
VATNFDRHEFIRAVRGKGLDDPTLQAMADALHKQYAAADLATKADLRGEIGLLRTELRTELRELEQRLTIKGATGLVILAGFLVVVKSFLLTSD